MKQNKLCGVYEGNAPYLFISYSHRDHNELIKLKFVLDKNGIRYWYDDGLHSGDDWNMMIAKHLRCASICLLLLSPNSAESQYVKNELIFSMNRQIPIYTLLLDDFELPLDIEMMLGRIHYTKMWDNYEKGLLEAIPVEVFYSEISKEKNENHALFEICEELHIRQGTKSYKGKHKLLNYPCLIQVDSVKSADKKDAIPLCVIASNINHPLFPKIYDIVLEDDEVFVYQEYRNETFLDEYLKSNTLTADTILEWILKVVDAMEYLFNRNLGLRDFARGSMVVTSDNQIGMNRLQNLYYGLVRLSEETRYYYFEREVQEIGILLFHLCTRKGSVLPLRIIDDKHYSEKFLTLINLVVQKCSKVDNGVQYRTFGEIKDDLKLLKISYSDALFLRQRQKKLKKYDSEREKRQMIFTSDEQYSRELIDSSDFKSKGNLEKEFGFDETVTLGNSLIDKEFISRFVEDKPLINVLICSTGQVMSFSKNEIMVGRDTQCCDLVWKQPFVSRLHLKIIKISDEEYIIQDMGASNRVIITRQNKEEPFMIIPNGQEKVPPGTILSVGNSKLQIL